MVIFVLIASSCAGGQPVSPRSTTTSQSPLDGALHWAGFVLAHAAWSVSDLDEDGFLIPIAFVEESGKRRLMRFHADTAKEANSKGKVEMKRLSARFSKWAFAWEEISPRVSGADHSLIVEFWAEGMTNPGRLIQKFEPFSRKGKFSILGDPTIIVSGKVLDQADVSRALVQVTEGIVGHPEASKLWETWARK